MGLYHCNIYSEALQRNTAFYVVLPRFSTLDEVTRKKKYQTLYLLHGGSDDYTKWIRRVPIERLTRKHGIAVVIPDANLSYYKNMRNGDGYWDYISKELPAIARMIFPLSDKRDDNFVAGLSMGGYGALKVALRNPGTYCEAASFSGVVDVVAHVNNRDSASYKNNQFFKDRPSTKDTMTFSFTDSNAIAGSDDDIKYLLDQLIEKEAVIPRIYQSCGTEDFLYRNNEDFKDHFLNKKVDLTYESWPGGHDWDFWEESLKRALNWFSFKNEPIYETEEHHGVDQM